MLLYFEQIVNNKNPLHTSLIYNLETVFQITALQRTYIKKEIQMQVGIPLG